MTQEKRKLLIVAGGILAVIAVSLFGSRKANAAVTPTIQPVTVSGGGGSGEGASYFTQLLMESIGSRSKVDDYGDNNANAITEPSPVNTQSPTTPTTTTTTQSEPTPTYSGGGGSFGAAKTYLN